MGDRVAEVEANGITAMLTTNIKESIADKIKRRLPTHLLPPISDSPDRSSQSIRIVGQVLQRHALGTEVSAAEGILRIPANSDHTISFDRDFQAA